MTDIIERAEKALDGVTEGDWAVRDGFVYPLSIRCGLGGIWERDARFIAAARTLVPELVAALKAARDIIAILIHDETASADYLNSIGVGISEQYRPVYDARLAEQHPESAS